MICHVRELSDVCHDNRMAPSLSAEALSFFPRIATDFSSSALTCAASFLSATEIGRSANSLEARGGPPVGDAPPLKEGS